MVDTTAKQIDLDAFLSDMPADTAAKLKAEAARIDELARYAQPVRGIEQQLRRPFLLAIVLFVIGVVLLLAGGRQLAMVRDVIGELGLCILLGALPGLAGYYAWRVRWRTKADKVAFIANRDHFLPHGVIYFPPDDEDGTPTVVRVDAGKAYKPKPTKNDKLKPGWIW